MTDIKKIRDIWFEAEKKMNNSWGVIPWKKIRKVCLSAGAVTLGIGVIFMIIGIVTDNNDLVRDTTFFVSIGIALVSLSIASHSVVISNQSDRRVKDIANANFLRVLSIFEDRRIDLQYLQLGYRKHPILIWKALVDMNEAEELLEHCDIDLPYQGRLIHLLNHLLKYINKVYTNILNCEEVEHLLEMFLIGLQVDDEFAGTKDAIRGRIRTLLDEQPDVEINEDYIRGIQGFIFEDIEKKNFVLYRDQIKEWYYSR